MMLNLRIFAVCLIVTLLTVLAACGGGSSGSAAPPMGVPVVAAFAPNSTPATADRVRLTGTSSGNLVTLDVRIGGPSTSQDIYGFAFDLRASNPSLLTLLSFSAGDALQPGGSGLTVQAAPVADGWTVGIDKLGAEPGNGIAPVEASVLRLVFEVRSAGSCTVRLDGSAASQPAAIDSNLQPIVSIAFDPSTVTLSGS